LQILRLFNKNKIKCIPLKGAQLIFFYDQELSKRPLRDLDVLINESQIDDAVRLLLQNGFFFKSNKDIKRGYKSSLIADLSMNHGADFICEDVACISDNINGMAIKNAPPLIKLSDEISHKLNLNQKNKINLIADRLNRSFYRVQENTNTNKLIACFFLEWGDSFSMEKLEDSRVLPAFLLNTYSCYPFNSCIESSKDFHNFTHEFIKKIPNI